MKKGEQNITVYVCALVVASIVLYGSFFEYISCAFAVVLLVTCVVYLIKNKQLVYTKDYNLIAILVLCSMYLVSSLYAVDKGYAMLGFFKFLPVGLMYFLICDKESTREQVIQMLPALGAIITFLTFLMMHFSIFRPYVTVADRLSGTFQYPNTYALFLLVCIIVAIWQKEKIKYLYIAVNLFGIIESGCRSIYIIGLILFIALAVSQKKYRKGIVIAIACVVAGVALLMLFAGNSAIAERIKSISINSSTLVGRLLYYKDAIPVIIKHPFGLGYYGYFFMEGEIQTGVYSVANVHNELLQIMLDVGIVPALMFFAMLIRSIVVKKNPLRNKVALLAITLHSMLDYNFQFVSILFIMLMFLDYGEVRKQKVGIVSYVGASVIAIAIIQGAVVYGISMLNYNTGKYENAYNMGHFNTMAQIKQLEQTDDINKAKDIAQSVIDRNKHMDMAYNAMAKYYLTDNNVEQFIINELKCIELAPYNHDYYVEFADYLFQACDLYLKSSEVESAKICYAQLNSIPDKFKELSDKTSSLAWKISDTPVFGMPVEYYTLMQQYEDRINNNENE